MSTHPFRRLVIPILIPLVTAAAGPLDLKDSRVRVPWPDFKQIVDQLAQRDTTGRVDTVFAPRDYVITSTAISGTVTGEKTAGLDAELVIQVFASEALKKSGWVRVPIGESNTNAGHAVVSGAESGGRSVPLLNESGALFLLMPRQGIFSVKLSYTCPVVNSEGTSRLFVNLPHSAVGYLDVNVPGKRVEATVNGIVQPSTASREGTRIRCALSAGGELSIALSPLAGEELEDAGPQMSPKVFATTGTLVFIKENQVRYRYRVDYQIWHKKVTSFSVAMPDTMQIEQVEGAGIALAIRGGWILQERNGNAG